MAAVFSDGQVASFPLDDIDLMPRDSNPFAALAGGCHIGGRPVLSLDTAAMQSIAVTCSTDKCIRVWDFEKRYCAVSKHFPAEASIQSQCVSPSEPSALSPRFGQLTRHSDIVTDSQ